MSALSHIRFISLFLILASVVLFGRAFSLQVVQGAERRDQAEHNRIRRELEPAMRGLFYDRTGKVLVKNIPNFIVSVLPYLLPENETDRESMLRRLSGVLGASYDEIQAKIREAGLASRSQIILAEHLSTDSALLLHTQLNRYPGLAIQTVAVREYFDGPAISHVLGYVGRVTDRDLQTNPGEYSSIDYIGKTGLEFIYESELRGVQGYRDVERDHLNREKRIIASAQPVSGKNLQTTIDQRVQRALFEALTSAVQKTRAPGGAAVAIDPRDGGVLAMVSTPSFDNNSFINGLSSEDYQRLLNDPAKPFLNRAVSGVYPSGSTIKPLIASAALQEHIVTPSTLIQSTGGIQIDKWFFPDWKAGGHGPTNLSKALAESVNTYFYTIGGGTDSVDGLGVDRLNRYMKLFGLDAVLGIDVPNEQGGFLPSKEWKEREKEESWYIGDTYHYSIGQGDVLVTPLQMAVATAAIANNGKVYQPHFARAWLNESLEKIEDVKPNIIREGFIDQANLKAVRQGLRQAVTDGSARALASFPVPVGAKTGTAELGETGKTHAWFTSFAPYDSPEIVITVIVEQGGEGHAAALPVAEAGFRAYFDLDTP
jgi:penicillin-binding protein 2